MVRLKVGWWAVDDMGDYGQITTVIHRNNSKRASDADEVWAIWKTVRKDSGYENRPLRVYRDELVATFTTEEVAIIQASVQRENRNREY